MFPYHGTSGIPECAKMPVMDDSTIEGQDSNFGVLPAQWNSGTDATSAPELAEDEQPRSLILGDRFV